jgi:dihydrofolate reductase
MRKVVVYELLSLDGVAEQPDDFIRDFDHVMRENLGRVIATQDSVLLGRRTYDDWAAFWPTSPYEPFATFINSVEKVRGNFHNARRDLGERHCHRRRASRVCLRSEAAARW